MIKKVDFVGASMRDVYLLGMEAATTLDGLRVLLAVVLDNSFELATRVHLAGLFPHTAPQELQEKFIEALIRSEEAGMVWLGVRQVARTGLVRYMDDVEAHVLDATRLAWTDDTTLGDLAGQALDILKAGKGVPEFGSDLA